MPIYPGMPSFPGDPVVTVEPAHSISRGDSYNVSAISLGSHTGTHVDPPRHFLTDGSGIDQVGLDALNGACHVVHLGPTVRSIGAREVSAVPDGARRVLFRTSNSERWSRSMEFFPDYVSVTPEGAGAIVDRRWSLIGIDSLSVELDPSGRFPVHHTLLGAGVLILEGLLLGEVPGGPAELACLPLRIRHGDGGPARAAVSRG